MDCSQSTKPRLRSIRRAYAPVSVMVSGGSAHHGHWALVCTKLPPAMVGSVVVVFCVVLDSAPGRGGGRRRRRERLVGGESEPRSTEIKSSPISRPKIVPRLDERRISLFLVFCLPIPSPPPPFADPHAEDWLFRPPRYPRHATPVSKLSRWSSPFSPRVSWRQHNTAFYSLTIVQFSNSNVQVENKRWASAHCPWEPIHGLHSGSPLCLDLIHRTPVYADTDCAALTSSPGVAPVLEVESSHSGAGIKLLSPYVAWNAIPSL